MQTRRPFASRAQAALIILMAISFLMVAQQFNETIFQLGLLLLIISTLLQIAFGNIPPEAEFRRSMIYLGIVAVILVAIVVISIAILPSLLQLGRG
jgi:hypothetical protein